MGGGERGDRKPPVLKDAEKRKKKTQTKRTGPPLSLRPMEGKKRRGRADFLNREEKKKKRGKNVEKRYVWIPLFAKGKEE